MKLSFLTLLTLLTGSLAVAVASVAGVGCKGTPDASAAQPPPPAASDSPISSAETANYKVDLKAVGTYRKGQASTFEIVVKTKGDYHVNEDYPTKFLASDAAKGVTYPKVKLERAKDTDAFALEKCGSGKDNCTLRVKVPFTPNDPGKVTIGGTLTVGICNPATCLIEKKVLALAVPVS